MTDPDLSPEAVGRECGHATTLAAMTRSGDDAYIDQHKDALFRLVDLARALSAALEAATARAVVAEQRCLAERLAMLKSEQARAEALSAALEAEKGNRRNETMAANAAMRLRDEFEARAEAAEARLARLRSAIVYATTELAQSAQDMPAMRAERHLHAALRSDGG